MNLLPSLVVLDMAGTTVSDTGSAVGRCLQAALANASFPVTLNQVNAVMGYPKPEAIRRLSGIVPESSESIRTIHDDFVRRMVEHYAQDAEVAPIPGAENTFRQLRQAGIRVALDTGFSRAIVTAILERFGWKDDVTIDATIASDEVERGRPHPDMVLRLMDRFGIIDPGAVAKVGDTPSDLLEGNAARCGWVIGVTQTGTSTQAELSAYPYTHLIDSAALLPDLFGL